MAGMNFGGTGAGKGVNFLSVPGDRLQSALRQTIIVILVLAALTVIFLLGTSGYLVYLEQEHEEVKAEVDKVVKSLESTANFEREFIMIKDKLDLYSEVNTSEKMADLFPRISALVPEGVRLQDMTIQKQSVEITALSNDLSSLTLFYNNLQRADGTSMDDGQVLKLKDLTYRDVSKDTTGQSVAGAGYIMSFTFNYIIETDTSRPLSPITNQGLLGITPVATGAGTTGQ